MKDIRDYLKYYIGQPVWIRKNFEGNDVVDTLTGKMVEEDIDMFELSDGKSYKPILRKLESMSEEDLLGWLDIASKIMGQQYDDATMRGQMLEALELIREHGLAAFSFDDDEILQAPHLFHYLLFRGFWLFGNDWFDEGLIIDKATIK